MRNRFVLSPFFLGQPLPALADLADLLGDAWINRPAAPDPPDPADPSDSAELAAMREAVHEGLAEWVRRCLERGERPVSIAGDCCSALGMLAGLRRGGGEPSLLWFDAHGDFNTPETSPSGFLGGMPLAILVGRGDDTLRRALGLEPFAEERVVLTDARALDPLERDLLESSRVVHRPRLADLADPALAPLPDGPLWVHFDADVVDAAESPGHRYPASGGPSAETVRAVFRRIAETGRLAAVSVSSWEPELDGDGTSRRVTMALLDELLGPSAVP